MKTHIELTNEDGRKMLFPVRDCAFFECRRGVEVRWRGQDCNHWVVKETMRKIKEMVKATEG